MAEKKSEAKKKNNSKSQKNKVSNKSKEKTFIDKIKSFWQFLWYDDSILSWITLIVLAFILIKFIFYPVLGLLMGTQFPIVAVVSSSMEHHPSPYDQWWVLNEDFYLKYNITQEKFSNFKFHNGFNKGDIMVLIGADPYDMNPGEILVYWSGRPYPIIHRYIGNNPEENKTQFLMTKGDNGLTNPWFIQTSYLNEKEISPDKVVGKAVLRIPYLGYVKIWATNLLGLMIN